jgi:modulator of FtsH protease HflC
MQAYDKALTHGDTRLVLRPDSDFFRYFNDPSGKSPPDGTALPAAPGAPAPAVANPPRSSSATK